MLCYVCRRPVETRRRELQLDTCHYCGDALARQQLRVKHSQVGPAYNKSGLAYLGGGRQAMLDAGRKASAVVIDSITPAMPRQSVKHKRRKQIGIWFDQNGDVRVWFAGDNPDALGATRKIYFGDGT